MSLTEGSCGGSTIRGGMLSVTSAGVSMRNILLKADEGIIGVFGDWRGESGSGRPLSEG